MNIPKFCLLFLWVAVFLCGCASIPKVTEPMQTEPIESTFSVSTAPSDPVPSDPVDPSTPSEPEHEHEYVAVMTKATCLDVGFTTYTCDCGDTYVGDRIEATGHQWSDWVVTKEPTVDETGEAVSICAMCENTVSRVLDKVIPNHTHSYSGKVTKEPTCTEEGILTSACECGSSYANPINKVAHSYKGTVTKPTCTEMGYTTYKCNSCSASYQDDFVSAKGHSYGNYKSNSDATCTKDGTKTGKCTACSATNTVVDTGSAKGHSYKATVTAPTCTEKGYTTNKCGACGDTYKDSYVNATGHKYGEYKPNGDATCTKDGTKTAICSNGCGTKDTKTDTGSKVDHDYKVTTTVESFITGPGYEYYKCASCKDTYSITLPEWTEDECNQFLRDVEAAAVKYINQFRVEQGSTSATVLPGLTKVAQYRAVQLQKRFAHNTDDTREAFSYYKYGEYVDLTPYGFPDQYYSANAREAIACSSAGNDRTADQLGYAFALQIHDSPDHWSYVGSSDYPFIAVGVDWSYARQFTMCILQVRTNAYE